MLENKILEVLIKNGKTKYLAKNIRVVEMMLNAKKVSVIALTYRDQLNSKVCRITADKIKFTLPLKFLVSIDDILSIEKYDVINLDKEMLKAITNHYIEKNDLLKKLYEQKIEVKNKDFEYKYKKGFFRQINIQDRTFRLIEPKSIIKRIESNRVEIYEK